MILWGFCLHIFVPIFKCKSSGAGYPLSPQHWNRATLAPYRDQCLCVPMARLSSFALGGPAGSVAGDKYEGYALPEISPS